jgi:hypothetical protein
MKSIITIKVPVVYMGQDILIWMRGWEIHKEGCLKGWALKVETFRAHPFKWP